MKCIWKITAVSAAAGGLAGGLPVLQRLVLLPFYMRTDNQWALSLLNRVCSLLLLPGKRIMYQISPPQEHYFETGPLLIAGAINFAFYFCIAFAVLATLFRRALEEERMRNVSLPLNGKAGRVVDAPASPGRRAFMAKSLGGAAGLTIIGAGSYSVLVRPGWLTVRRLTVPIIGLPAVLEGFRIAQLTDIHHDEWISVEHVRSAVDMVNRLGVDLVALTGDYVTAQGVLIGPAVAELARLKARTGVVGVMGNHDWWADPDETRRQFAAFDIPLIDNARRFVSPERRLVAEAEPGGICIGGVGDLWEDEVDPERALAGVAAAMPRILLSHNPDVTEQGAIGAGDVRIDLILSGHTHGGQVRLPLIGTPVVPSSYGQKYVQGLVQGPHCRVQISAGIGMAVLPVRFCVPPEIVVIELTVAGS